MADVTLAMQAKSDQLNAVDILGAPRVIKIRKVEVKESEQPVWIYFDGDNNRPWKPSKGMVRVLSAGWGNESDNWIGKLVEIYCEDTVIYAGKPVGGIRISGMSDIDKSGVKLPLALSRSKRTVIDIRHIESERNTYPEEKFKKALPTMAEYVKSGKKTLQQIISQCQNTGDLTSEQITQLEDACKESEDENGNTE